MFTLSYNNNRLREAQSHLEHLARAGDINALLHHNLAEAHILEFETSPQRTLRANAFHNALTSTRCLLSCVPALRELAKTKEQNNRLDQLQAKFETVKKNAADYYTVHRSSSAKTVFESVSSFLGVEAILPERTGEQRTLFGTGRISIGWKDTMKGRKTGQPPLATAVAPPSEVTVPPTTPPVPEAKSEASTPSVQAAATKPQTAEEGAAVNAIGPDVPTTMPLPPKEAKKNKRGKATPA